MYISSSLADQLIIDSSTLENMLSETFDQSKRFHSRRTKDLKLSVVIRASTSDQRKPAQTVEGNRLALLACFA